jgi:two-component system cell cycle response regulator
LQEDKIAMEMAGATAHEINQPLTSLLLSIDMLKTSKIPQVREKSLERIEESAKRIENIIKHISKITRYETRDYAGKHAIIKIEKDDSS